MALDLVSPDAPSPTDPAGLDFESLLAIKRPELVDMWTEAFATAPPYGISQALLARLLAYDLQAARRGGLTQRVQKRLALIRSGEAPRPATPKLKPGARLVREWNGVAHVVDVTAAGFEYRGETYRSLSRIAEAITGAHWSGPRFFGLRSKSAAKGARR